MVKDQITVTIDRTVLKRVEAVMRENYPGASRSYVIERLLREALTSRRDISVTK